MPRVYYTDSSRERRRFEPESSDYASDSEAVTDIESDSNDSSQSIVFEKPRNQRAAAKVTKPKPGAAVTKQRHVSKDIRDATGRKPLQKACQRNDLAKVLELLEMNPDIEDRDYAGTAALHTAALQGNFEIVQSLVDAGAILDVRSGPEELDTPLMDAAANCYSDIVKLLLEKGSDPRISNAFGRTAYDFIDETDPDFASIGEMLQAKSRELYAENIEIITDPTALPALFPPGYTGIIRAPAPLFLNVTKKAAKAEIVDRASKGDLEYVGAALERGWSPTVEALVQAAGYGHSEVVGLLLAFGLEANQEFEGTTALFEAIKRKHLTTAKLLIESGANLRNRDKLVETVEYLPNFSELKRLVIPNLPEEPYQKPIRRLQKILINKHRLDSTNQDSGKPADSITDRSKPRSTSKRSFDSIDNHTSSESKSNEQRSAPSARSPTPPVFKKERSSSGSLSPKAIKPTIENQNRPQPPSRSVSESKSASAPPVQPTPEATAPPVPAAPSPPQIPISQKQPQTAEDVKPQISRNSLWSIKPAKRIRKSSDESTTPQPVEQAVEPTVSREHSPQTTDLPGDSASQQQSQSQIGSEAIPQPQLESQPAPHPEPEQLPASEPTADNTVEHNSESEMDVDTSTTSIENAKMWEDRAAELEELAKKRERERKDREQKMLSNLAKEKAEQNTSNSPPSVESEDSSNIELKDQKTESVEHLPYALRLLAITKGQKQSPTPVLHHNVDGLKYYLDIQVALLTGTPQLHAVYPNIPKVFLTDNQKQQLWDFCSFWISPPNCTLEIVEENKEKFMKLNMCWVSANEVDEKLFANKAPKSVKISLDLPPKKLTIAASPAMRNVMEIEAQSQW